MLPALHLALHSPCNIFYCNYGSHHAHIETRLSREADMLHLDFKKQTALTFTLLAQMTHSGTSNLNLKLPETNIRNITLKADFRNQHPTPFS